MMGDRAGKIKVSPIVRSLEEQKGWEEEYRIQYGAV